MASFLNDRESLTPSKRKRARHSTGEADGPLSSTLDSEDMFSEGTSTRSKKRKKDKKKKRRSEKIEIVEPSLDEEEEAEVDVMVKVEVGQEEEGVSEGVDEDIAPELHGGQGHAAAVALTGIGIVPPGWDSPAIELLLDRIEACCVQEPSRLMSWACQQEKLDWNIISFSEHNPDDCREMWAQISTKVRKFRTLQELIADAKDFQKNRHGGIFAANKKKMTLLHPDQPKKPLSPYLKFYLDKKSKYLAKNPDLKGTDLAKLMGQKYNALSDSKKEKYIKEYQKESEEFKVKMEKFKEEHKELIAEFESLAKERHLSAAGIKPSGPPKPVTAQGLFIKEKVDQELVKNSNQSRRELYTIYQEKWMKKLTDKKKWKYILMAIEAKKTYDVEMEEYCKHHPDYTPKVISTFLTKAEIKIKDDKEGKPQKPPSNGYQYFSIEVMKNFKHIPAHERMDKAATMWKQMSTADKESYTEKVKALKETYVVKLREYVSNLAPEEQDQYQAELEHCEREANPNAHSDRKSSKKAKSPTPTKADKSAKAKSSSSGRKPVTPVFLFINDMRADYEKKHPGSDSTDVSKQLLKQYQTLSKEKKDEYLRRAAEEKEKLAAEAAENVPQSSGPGSKVTAQMLMDMGEPQKPVGSGYQLFSQEMLRKLSHIPNKDRMKAISEQWKSKTEDEKNVYIKKRQSLWDGYQKRLKKFTKGLSSKELKTYYKLKGGPPKKKSRGSKKAESDSESDDDEDDEDEDKENKADDDESSDEDSSDDEDEDETEDKKGQDSTVKKEPASSDSDSSDSDSESDSDDDEDQKIVNGTKSGTKDNKLTTQEVFDSGSSSSEFSLDSDSDDEKEGDKTSPGSGVVKMSPLKAAKSTTKTAKGAKGRTEADSSSSSDSSSDSGSDSE